jgi:hypothetical protein
MGYSSLHATWAPRPYTQHGRLVLTCNMGASSLHATWAQTIVCTQMRVTVVVCGSSASSLHATWAPRTHMQHGRLVLTCNMGASSLHATWAQTIVCRQMRVTVVVYGSSASSRNISRIIGCKRPNSRAIKRELLHVSPSTAEIMAFPLASVTLYALAETYYRLDDVDQDNVACILVRSLDNTHRAFRAFRGYLTRRSIATTLLESVTPCDDD